jgi:hypothetical protein
MDKRRVLEVALAASTGVLLIGAAKAFGSILPNRDLEEEPEEPDGPIDFETLQPGQEVPASTKVSPNFTVGEFTQRGAPYTPYPAQWIASRLQPLTQVLETIRAAAGGRSIKITSGYRSEAYNTKIYQAKGKTPTKSQHIQGRAADIQIEGMRASDVHALILKLYREGKIAIGGLGKYPTFTHVDIRPTATLAQWTKKS